MCVLLLAAGVKCRRLQMYATLGTVSRAAETICPAWQGPQIYGVYVPLHLWAGDEKIPLFFCPTPSLPRMYPSTSVFFSLFRPILHDVPLDTHRVSQGGNRDIRVVLLGRECSRKVSRLAGVVFMTCHLEAAWISETPLEIGSGLARRKVSGDLIPAPC